MYAIRSYYGRAIYRALEIGHGGGIDRPGAGVIPGADQHVQLLGDAHLGDQGFGLGLVIGIVLDGTAATAAVITVVTTDDDTCEGDGDGHAEHIKLGLKNHHVCTSLKRYRYCYCLADPWPDNQDGKGSHGFV